MAFPINSPEVPGPVALGVPGLPADLKTAAVPRNVPLSKAASLPPPPPEPGEWIRLIDQAECSMHEQFQQLRNSLGKVSSALRPTTQGKESERRAVERLLQAEREQMAAQRAQEQEQLRATMQQLADAWLRLEQEQLAVAGHRNQSMASALTAGNLQPNECPPAECPPSSSPWWTSNEHSLHSSSVASAVPAPVPRGLTEMETHPRPMALGMVDATSHEEMFHRLRVDLKRHNK